MNRVVLKGIEARDKLVRGVDLLADIVSSTMGPCGGNVVLEKGLRATNDGYKIAKEISLDDEIEDLGQRFVKEGVARANDASGDGSSTAIVLCRAVLKECLSYLPGGKIIASRIPPMELLAKMKAEVEFVTKELDARSEPVTSKEMLVEVTKVAVENDTLAKLIGETQWNLGTEGAIIPEESNDRECSIERIKGVRIDNGFGTSRAINNIEKQTLELTDMPVILTSHTIKDLSQVSAILDKFLKTGKKDIVVIARAWTDEAIQHVMLNHKNNFRIWPLNTPYTDLHEVMKDLQAALGGTYFDSETTDTKDMTLSDIGFASRVSAGRYSAIIAGASTPEAKERIKKRVADLEEQYKGSESEFEKKSIQSRIAQLTNGFALLKVGAQSDRERKYLFDKAEDGCNTARAALQEGVVRGAGIALKEIAEGLPKESVLKNALPSIYTAIMANAGTEFEVEPWVKDSVKILKTALTTAVSVAGTLATAAGAIHTKFPRPIDELIHKKSTPSTQGE